MINAFGIWLKAHSNCYSIARAEQYNYYIRFVFMHVWLQICCRSHCRSNTEQQILHSNRAVLQFWCIRHTSKENETIETSCWTEQNWKIQIQTRTFVPHMDTERNTRSHTLNFIECVEHISCNMSLLRMHCLLCTVYARYNHHSQLPAFFFLLLCSYFMPNASQKTQINMMNRWKKKLFTNINSLHT